MSATAQNRKPYNRILASRPLPGLPGQISELSGTSCEGFPPCAGRVYSGTASSVQCATHVGFPQARVPQAMAKSTISKSMPTTALRDPGVRACCSRKGRRPQIACSENGRGPKPAPATQFDRIALLLQGGGALGAYQAGVYQALAETGLHPDWVVGISIGAINAAIIAGNAPERRIEKLHEFWEEITAPAMGFHADVFGLFERGEARTLANQVSAAMVAYVGSTRLLQTAHHQSVVSSSRHHRGDELLRHAAAEGHARALHRLRPRQLPRRKRVSASVPSMCVPATCLFRQRDTRDRTRACNGQRRIAAWLPCRRDRGRALLGWRPCLEHAASNGS